MNTTPGNVEMVTGNITAMEYWNEKYFYFRIPAIVFLAVLFPVGILGNAFTIYIFGFQFKTRIFTFFLILIAISDIACSLIGIPLEIHRLFIYYNYFPIVTCKLKTFITFLFHIYSTTVLVMISLERYISVTRSTERPMNFNTATFLGIIILILSFLFAVPVYTWTRVRFIKLDNGIIVYQCATYLQRELWYYIVGMLIFYLINCTMMFALYWFVFLTIRIQNRWNKRSLSEAITELDISSVKEIHEILTRQDLMNRIAIWITFSTLLIQFLSFAYILLRKFETYPLAPSVADYFILIFSEIWVLKCVLNAIVYAFISADYRKEALNIFRNLLCFETSHENLESTPENID